jgi:hypothetical protein
MARYFKFCRWALLGMLLLPASHFPAQAQDDDDPPASAPEHAAGDDDDVDAEVEAEAAHKPSAQGDVAWRKGQALEVLWGTRWWAARIVDVKTEDGAQKYKIHYDGWGDNWDEWITTDRMKAVGAPAPASNPAARPAGPPAAKPAPVARPYVAPRGALPPSKAIAHGIYFRLKSAFWGGRLSFEQDHWVFWNDGRFYNDVPKGGLEGFGFVQAWKAEPKSTGIYAIEGDKIRFSYADGSQSEEEFKRDKEGIHIGGLFTSKQKAFPKDARIAGSWSGGNSVGGGTATYVGYARSLTLRKDGTFDSSSIGSFSVTGDTTTTSGGSENGSGGTYALSGNTLTLKHKDGKATRHTVYPYELGEGRTGFNLDGLLLHPPRK